MNRAEPIGAAVLFAFVLLIAIAILSGGSHSKTRAENAVRATGATNVDLDGWAWFACGKGDTYAWKFTAENATGQAVEGAVCCGILKGCTVRY